MITIRDLWKNKHEREKNIDETRCMSSDEQINVTYQGCYNFMVNNNILNSSMSMVRSAVDFGGMNHVNTSLR